MIRLMWFGARQTSASGGGSANLAGRFRPAADKIPAMARKRFGAVLACRQGMSVYSPQYHAMVSSPGPTRTEARAESVTSTATKSADGGVKQDESFFEHVLDVVNPLQHLPIIGTIYRAITGDKMGPVEKIAGDTLYGGMWGAIASIADVAFESITGKSFEDTALSLFKGDGKAKTTKIAQAPVTTSSSLPTPTFPALPSSTEAGASDGLDVAAFTNALSSKGVDGDTASRALYAYRRSMGLVGQSPVLATVH
jgi:hypothetical protein